MITKQYKIKIKEILGGRYCPKIILHLTKKEIFNAKGEVFSTASIQKIVSGTQPNEEVEIEIINLMDRTKKRQEELQSKMNSK